MGHLHEAVDGVSNALMISAILPPAGPAPIINCSDILSEHCFPIMVATFVAGCITCAFTAAYGMGKDIHKVSQALLRNARVAANVATLSLSAVIVGTTIAVTAITFFARPLVGLVVGGLLTVGAALLVKGIRALSNGNPPRK